MLNGELVDAPDGVRGFDCNQTLDATLVKALFDAGYRFAIRYVRREQPHHSDLTAEEAETILEGGLALVAVQHVESESSWSPSESKGRQYGTTAAAEVLAIGFPAGAVVWCDLEGVAPHTGSDDVVAYCREWARAVADAGFQPGLYVGWHCGLTPEQLYHQTPFTRYWAAYNLNADQFPETRGVQMRQHEAKASDIPRNADIGLDVDTTAADALGDHATLLAPRGWVDSL